jgi:hypothetical protein
VTAAPGLAARGYRLAIGEDTVPQISVVRSPHVSVAPLMIGAGAGISGTDGRYLLQAVRRALPYGAGFALTPMVAAHRAGDELVDAFMPILPYSDVSVGEQIERMHDAPDELLLDDLRRIYGNALPRAWRPAAEHPRMWFDSLALATGYTFDAVAASWHAAAPAIDREIQRVGTALVRGGHDVLLNSPHPRLRYARGMLNFDIRLRRMVGLGGRRLVLVPMTATLTPCWRASNCPALPTSATTCRGIRCPGAVATAMRWRCCSGRCAHGRYACSRAR